MVNKKKREQDRESKNRGRGRRRSKGEKTGRTVRGIKGRKKTDKRAEEKRIREKRS